MFLVVPSRFSGRVSFNRCYFIGRNKRLHYHPELVEGRIGVVANNDNYYIPNCITAIENLLRRTVVRSVILIITCEGYNCYQPFLIIEAYWSQRATEEKQRAAEKPLRSLRETKSSNKEYFKLNKGTSTMLNRIYFAQWLRDRSGKPGEALRQAQCDSLSAGFVPDLQRIARTKVDQNSERRQP